MDPGKALIPALHSQLNQPNTVRQTQKIQQQLKSSMGSELKATFYGDKRQKLYLM